MSKIKLELCLVIEGIEETVPLIVEYTHHKASSGGGISPDEPAHCEVQSVKPDGGSLTLLAAMEFALERLTDGDEFQTVLAQDAFEDRAVAEEYRADAARDERMTRDWESGR